MHTHLYEYDCAAKPLTLFLIPLQSGERSC